jgi:hypothetical protein
MHVKTALLPLACLFSAALALSACSSSSTDTTAADSVSEVTVESTIAASASESTTVDSLAQADSTGPAQAPVTTIGPMTKYTLVSLVAGDRACYVELTFPGGGATLPGDFELCPGGPKDASAFIGKVVTYTTEKSNIQAASCEGNDSCTESEEVDLVISLADAASVQTLVVQ